MALSQLNTGVAELDFDQLKDYLSMMSPQQRQQVAAQYKNSPYASIIIPMAMGISQEEQQKAQAMQAQQQGAQQQQPKVVDQAIAQMAPQQLPEDQGIAQLPAQNIAQMADGGIAGYADGSLPQDVYSGDSEYGGPGMAQGGAVERYQSQGLVADPLADFKAQLDAAINRGEMTQQDAAMILADAQRTKNPAPSWKYNAPSAAQSLPVPGMDPAAAQRLEELGQIVDQSRNAVKEFRKRGSGSMTEYRDLTQKAAAAQKEYETFAATIPQINTPAFAAPRKPTVPNRPAVTSVSAATPPTYEAAKKETEARAAPQVPVEDAEDKKREAQEKFRLSEIQDQNELAKQAAKLPKKKRDEAEKIGAEAVPDASKFSKDDLVVFGLALMASGGKQRSLLSAVGEAGLATVAERRAQKKEEREDFYRRALAAEALGKAGYYAGGGGRKSNLSGLFGAIDKADNRARTIAQDLWKDYGERKKLAEKGFTDFDSLYDYYRQRERKAIVGGVVKDARVIDEEDQDQG